MRPEDMAPGAMMTVYPFRESERGDEEQLRKVEDAADAPAMLRFRPESAVVQQRSGSATVEFVAYSKICTHLGCPRLCTTPRPASASAPATSPRLT